MKIGETTILVVLFILSLSSIAVIFEKFFYLRRYADKSDFESVISDLTSGNKENLAHKTLSVLQKNAKHREQLQLAYREFLLSERLRLEKGLNYLATLGANAPFIGLLGTVLGIIEAFSALASNQTGSQAVMAGISQALIATAVGLFVAIPAVIAFNVFSNKLRQAFMQCERVKEVFILKQFHS